MKSCHDCCSFTESTHTVYAASLVIDFSKASNLERISSKSAACCASNLSSRAAVSESTLLSDPSDRHKLGRFCTTPTDTGYI